MRQKVSKRELMRVLGAGVPQTVGQLAHNDGITQQRIVALEGRMEQAEAFRALPFWQRVRWIFRGEQ